MKNSDITRIKELLGKGTPRPWAFDDEDHTRISGIDRRKDQGGVVAFLSNNTRHVNRELIVAAVNAIPALLAERERLREFIRKSDPRNCSALYDELAEDFYKATGFMAPGKSVPPEMSYTDEQEKKRQELYQPFCNKWHEDRFDAALEEK